MSSESEIEIEARIDCVNDFAKVTRVKGFTETKLQWIQRLCKIRAVIVSERSEELSYEQVEKRQDLISYAKRRALNLYFEGRISFEMHEMTRMLHLTFYLGRKFQVVYLGKAIRPRDPNIGRYTTKDNCRVSRRGKEDF